MSRPGALRPGASSGRLLFVVVVLSALVVVALIARHQSTSAESSTSIRLQQGGNATNVNTTAALEVRTLQSWTLALVPRHSRRAHQLSPSATVRRRITGATNLGAFSSSSSRASTCQNQSPAAAERGARRWAVSRRGPASPPSPCLGERTQTASRGRGVASWRWTCSTAYRSQSRRTSACPARALTSHNGCDNKRRSAASAGALTRRAPTWASAAYRAHVLHTGAAALHGPVQAAARPTKGPARGGAAHLFPVGRQHHAGRVRRRAPGDPPRARLRALRAGHSLPGARTMHEHLCDLKTVSPGPC